MTRGDKILYIVCGLLFAAMALLPLFGASGFLLRTITLALMYAVMALAWNFIGGYTGYSAFGNVAFFGIGATVTGVMMAKMHWDFAPAVLLGGVICSLLSFLIGPALLRLRGHYFAVATLGIANAAREIVAGWDDVTGGGIGLNLPLNTDKDFYTLIYYIFLMLTILSAVITYLISRNKLGFGWLAIRENEEGAKALGIDATLYKTLAWVLACFIVGITGGIYAYYNTAISPEAIFNPLYSTTPILITLLGGTGTVVGPILGAMILLPLSTWLLFNFPGIQPALLGIIIILTIIFLPRGLYEYLSGRRKLTLAALLKNPRDNQA
ncbi:MAG TPA: branched-chain amino acid ABC transporter permease [Thermoflexales bacterium]|nr:branched-chain amino acid ABC transporter permease [Thermoflexales bacterium]HQZ22206.1 branched-chain amino acid ABC transporter permease [Thermoflexales bacterium]